MTRDVPVINDSQIFPEIPSSVRLAILLPTARWTPMAQSVIGSLLGVANEEVAVLIADNSENPEKRDFLHKLRTINPYLIAVCHEKNIGAKDNFRYLFDWCRNVEYVAIMADDDWISPTYHIDAYRTLLANPQAACAEIGTTFVDFGDGRLKNVSQPTMSGSTPFERMQLWNGWIARVTMYNVSRRSALQSAIDYLRSAPVLGLTLSEDLWELSRLAHGDFLSGPGPGSLIHYPAHASMHGDPMQRFYDLLCKDVGLAMPSVPFMHLSTAVQCAMFLMGNMSPIVDPMQKAACGQYTFTHVFRDAFIPNITRASELPGVREVIEQNPAVRDGFIRYCNPPFVETPVFGREIFDWMVAILRATESEPLKGESRLSERFVQFTESLNIETEAWRQIENFIEKTQAAARGVAERRRLPEYQLQEAVSAFHGGEIEAAANALAPLLEQLPETPCRRLICPSSVPRKVFLRKPGSSSRGPMEIAPERADLKAALGRAF